MAPAFFVTQIEGVWRKKTFIVRFFQCRRFDSFHCDFWYQPKNIATHLSHQEPITPKSIYTAHFCTNGLLYHKIFIEKQCFIFISLHNNVFTPNTLWTKESKTFCHQKHSPHVSHELHKQAILKAHCPTPCTAKNRSWEPQNGVAKLFSFSTWATSSNWPPWFYGGSSSNGGGLLYTFLMSFEGRQLFSQQQNVVGSSACS